MDGGLLHGDADVAGFLTSGGTESILCAVLAARERAAEERGITEPEIVLAESAHAAFHKAAHNFGLIVRKAPVRADWTADVEAMAALIGPNTALVVGSAPQYPQGVQDDIPAIAALATSVGAQLSRRRVHGRVRAAVRRDARAGRSRRGTSGSRASRRSRPTSTSWAMHRRAFR